ncbi:MAG: PorT family protein [bacterium]|nr:PorT family protein [bacterium]
MKRTAILLVMALLMVSQLTYAADLRYGVKLGVNLANVSVDPAPSGIDYKTRTGFGFGGIVNYSINEKMDVRTEILYLMKGTKVEAGSVSNEWKVDNLVVAPFYTYTLAQWDCKINPGHDAKFFFQAGPEIGIKMQAKDKNGNNLTNWNSSEVALNIGAGLAIPVGPGHLIPDVRYSMGLTNLTTTSGLTVKSSGIQVMFGYLF